MVEKFGFKKLSFAGVLKDVVSVLFGWQRDMLEGSTKESREWREKVDEWWASKLNMPKLTPRFVLQWFGTDLFRNYFHPDIWICCVEKQLNLYPNVVITDCRFPNEISMLKNNGAKLVKINRGISPEWVKLYESGQIEKPEDIHPSEYMWIKQIFDYTIENNGTIKDLEEFCSQLKNI